MLIIGNNCFIGNIFIHVQNVFLWITMTCNLTPVYSTKKHSLPYLLHSLKIFNKTDTSPSGYAIQKVHIKIVVLFQRFKLFSFLIFSVISKINVSLLNISKIKFIPTKHLIQQLYVTKRRYIFIQIKFGKINGLKSQAGQRK